jgi:hypothetical protein
MCRWEEYDFFITRSLHSHYARKDLAFVMKCLVRVIVMVMNLGALVVRVGKGELHPTPCASSNITFNLPPTIGPVFYCSWVFSSQ